LINLLVSLTAEWGLGTIASNF